MTGASRRGLTGLLAAVAVSTLGTRMSFLALPWFVLSVSGSPTLTGLVAAAELTPYVAVQAIGGPFVDRLGAWRTSVATDVGAAATVGAIPLLHAADVLPLGVLAALVAVAGALRGAGDAARDVLVPGVAGESGFGLERAAGLMDGMSRGASMVGAPLAGVLVGVTSAVNVLAIDAATFAGSAALVAILVPRGAEPAVARHDDAHQSYLASLREGFACLRADRLLLGIGAMVLVSNLLDQAAGAVLIPTWSVQVAHSSVALGLIGGTFAIGALVGNAVITWLGPRLSRYRVYSFGFVLAGVPRLVVLGLASSLSPVLAVCVVAGMAAGGINPVLGAVEYERVPRHLQARVLGALGATAWAGIPIGSLAGGALAELIGVQHALLATAAVYLVTTLTPFVFPVWRQMERHDPPPCSDVDGPDVAALVAR